MLNNSRPPTLKTYSVILADPPWAYQSGGRNGAAENHYNTMSVEDICSLPVKNLAAPSAALVLWGTWPHMEGALKVVKAWGFKQISGFPWIKLQRNPLIDLFGDHNMIPTWGTGYWIRGCSEYVIIGKRGNFSPPDDPPMGLLDNTPAGLMSKRFRHSRKPENIHSYCEWLSPGPYLELFARRPAGPGWDVFGNEVEGSISLESYT